MTNVMTWNTGITESLSNHDKCAEIFHFVAEFLKKENAIVFLQQIVYKKPHSQTQHDIFKMFQEYFQEKYSIEFYKGSSFMMTVAIGPKDRLKALGTEYLPNGRPKNRSVAVEFNNISFLGVHGDNGMDNKLFLNGINGKADVILGDFNAGNYPESENSKMFNGILGEHICICNMPTKITGSGRRTCIDHVFVRDNLVSGCANLIVHEEIILSDHFPITFEILQGREKKG